jgi:hypothetical protein
MDNHLNNPVLNFHAGLQKNVTNAADGMVK